ncbi:MAG: RimK family alpha-L-glutamate ligase [Candidatus Micrarchaeota archaeon]|nr:RimK family alpha-L-glutamate ligase [Candidatus Micrarchaeota archaeon]MDE1849988.1 RimK family alpha-L-glutamate ligase [Candidatus Micrarchaeota archaeon]
MRIGLIRPHEIEYNRQDLADLESAAKAMGHDISSIFIDKLGIDIKSGKIRLTQIVSRNEFEEIEADGAILRHLGIVKDFEQFSSRVWSVRAIEETGIYVMNNAVSWLMASDKLASLTLLAKNGLPVPRTFLSEDMYVAYKAVQDMGEVVIKPLRGAMGFGVFRVNDPDVAMHIFSYFTNLSKPLYMQEYIEKKGMGDYRVVVIGGQVAGTEFRKGKDWKSNVAQGAIPIAVKTNGEMAEIAVKAAEVLKLDYAGIDIAEGKDGYSILEANPTMSWQGFRQATKIDVAELLIKHLAEKVRG